MKCLITILIVVISAFSSYAQNVVIQRTATEIRFRFIRVKSADADAEPEIKKFTISHFSVQ